MSPIVRLRYSVAGPARYISHLDRSRAIERALRRARTPVAYSQGFNPRPKVSFGPPLPLGVVSRAEYLDLELTEYSDSVLPTLAGAMPPGLRLLAGGLVRGKVESLMSFINAAEYRVVARGPAGMRDRIAEVLENILSEGEIIIRKEAKGKTKKKDLRPGIYELAFVGWGSRRLFDFTVPEGAEDRYYLFEMTLAVGNKGSVRPEEVMEAVGRRCPLEVEFPLLHIERIRLFRRTEHSSTDPLDLCDPISSGVL